MKFLLRKNLRELIGFLKLGKPIACSQGEWWIESGVKFFFNNLFGGERKRLLALAAAFEKELDFLEALPVRFKGLTGQAAQAFDVELYFEAARMIAKNLTLLRNPEALKAKQRLSFKVLALKYRLEETNGGMDLFPIQHSLVNILRRSVLQWKRQHAVIADDQKEISERDLLQIQATSQYPEFVQLLFQDEALCENWMLWTFRDKNASQFFIEYPFIQQKLVECNLNGRIGRMGGGDLKIQKVPSRGTALFEKIVTLPFEGVDINILDESCEVIFKGNYRLTIGEVFQIFKDKMYRVGNLEYLAHGITNWNVHHWAYWDALSGDYKKIELAHSQWWQQLPVFEIISRGEAFQRYGKQLNGYSWCASATATRGSRTLDFENTHAFLEIAIPWGDGRYAIYDFGKFALQFPSSFYEGVAMFCHNLHATVAYPDENVFYTHRQITHHSFEITPEQGWKLMELLRKDMMKSFNDNFIYQITSENCAKWTHCILEEVVGKEKVPDMFRMNLLHTEPLGPVKYIFSLIKKLPVCMQTPVMVYCHIPMGAAKETWIIEGGKYVCKSLTRHHFFATGEIFLPAMLHKKKELGHLDGLVLFKTHVESYVKHIYVNILYTLPRGFRAFLRREKLNGFFYVTSYLARFVLVDFLDSDLGLPEKKSRIILVR